MRDATYERLEPAQAAAWLAEHPQALVLDARDAAAHAAGAIGGAQGQVLRLDGRNHEALLLREPRNRPVFIYCYRGHASQTYAQMFADFGFIRVADLVGGHEAWARAAAQAAAASPGADAAAAAPAPWLADWLARHGFADAHRPAAHGNTPLMHAAWRGEAAVLEALLALGADPRASNGDGNTALWLACVHGDPAGVRRLAAAGAPVDHANLTGATCLMYAASSGKPAIVQTLLALGADPRLTTQDDFSALDMAATLECLSLLRAAARATA